MKLKLLAFVLAVFVLLGGKTYANEIELVSFAREVERFGVVAPRFSFSIIDGDPDDTANVEAFIEVTAPSGLKVRVPAFCLSNSEKNNTSLWEARFSPGEKGVYSFSAGIIKPGIKDPVSSLSGRFDVHDNGLKGGLVRNPYNDNYLMFASGKPFFGIGHNIPWVFNSNPEIFGRYFSLLAEAGGNMTRVWLCDCSFPLERNRLGYFSRTSSEGIDRMLELAEEHGIYVILCLNTYGDLMPERGFWGEGRWKNNPYNIVNGGPCEMPEDFFTDPEAIRRYKNKIRYIMARWGYSPNILAFELWNEYNAPVDWTKDIASYIRGMDHTGKMITTSLGYPDDAGLDEALIWQLDDIDIVTYHIYGDGKRKDLINPLTQKSTEALTQYIKPFLVSEYGIDYSRDDRHYDIRGEGVALHNSIWASAMSGNLGAAMNWWHDTYVRPNDLYGHYRALADFLQGIDWNSRDISFPEVSLVRVRNNSLRPFGKKDALIFPLNFWGRPELNEFTVLGNGDLAGGGLPLKYLHGSEKKDKKVDQTYNLNFADEGEFVVRVGTVSQGGHLKAYIDGVMVAERIFPAGPGRGPWKRSRYLRKYEIYQCLYDEDFTFTVPAGPKTIRLTNSGLDWIGIDKITLKGYVESDVANARCLGLKVGDTRMFWIHNRDSNWKNVYRKKGVPIIDEAYFEVYGIKSGTYSLEFWNTYSGEIISRREVVPSNGRIRIFLPDFSNDIACKLVPVEQN